MLFSTLYCLCIRQNWISSLQWSLILFRLPIKLLLLRILHRRGRFRFRKLRLRLPQTNILWLAFQDWQALIWAFDTLSNLTRLPLLRKFGLNEFIIHIFPISHIVYRVLEWTLLLEIYIRKCFQNIRRICLVDVTFEEYNLLLRTATHIIRFIVFNVAAYIQEVYRRIEIGIWVVGFGWL